MLSACLRIIALLKLRLVLGLHPLGWCPKMSGGVAQLLGVVIENLLPKPFGLPRPDNLGHLEEVKVVTRFL